MSNDRHTKSLRQIFFKRCAAMFVVFSLFAGGFAGLFHNASAATPPRIVMYQGRLLNSNSVPLSDSTATMSFALYDALSGGTCLWSNNSDTCATIATRSVTLTAGLFSEALGDTGASYAAIAESVFMDHATVYLEVTVNGETLTPRKQMLAAPYALNSDALDGYSTTTSGSTSSKVPVFDTSGNLVITGSPQGSGIHQGSLYINPASGVVSADEMLLGLAVEGSAKFSVDEDGDVVASGNVIAGGSTLVAPFSVDVTNGVVRIGDGSASNAILDLYAPDGSTGRFSYVNGDSWRMTGGDFSFTGNGALPTSSGETEAYAQFSETISGTSGNNLAALKMYGTQSDVAYFAVEGSGTTSHTVASIHGFLTTSGATSVATYANGVIGSVENGSTNASFLEAGGYLSGLYGKVSHVAAATTIADVRGVFGEALSTTGTITDAFGLYGTITNGGGTVTNGYGVYGKNTAAGNVRYGVYGQVSGGATNYAGYFTGAQVQIDDDINPDSPTLANGSGDLYVSDALEVRGSVLFDELGGALNTFTYRSPYATTIAAAQFITDGLTSGTGARFVRGDDGVVAFTGEVVSIEQNDVGSDNAGTALQIDQAGGGTAIGLRITQSTTSAHSANATGNNALVIDVNEAASADNAIVMRSDADGTADTEFRVTTAGDAYADGAFTGAGADFAEFFPTNDATLSDHHLACIDPTDAENVKRCEASNRNIVGVISTNPAFIGNAVGDGTEDYRNDARYRLVGLTGQIETLATAADGAIAVGDPITTSSFTAGYGAKAFGPVRIVGFALEALPSGTGVIRVLVNAQWYGSDVFTALGSATRVTGDLGLAAMHIATATSALADSPFFTLRGSVWDGAAAQDQSMGMKTTVSAMNEYRLSIVNTASTEVALVNQDGDMMLAGKLYPSDRGVMQDEKYIYYDGSSGGGGDFMRTNASGWSTGSYDFAEMFPSPDALRPGEVVVFGDAKEEVKRSTGERYSRTIAGIVSTRPGFLAGENTPGTYPVALSGRVPTFVSTENGVIHIGDPLTTSSQPGYAMRATEAGPIVGYAAEEFLGATGSIIVYVNASYYAGTPVEEGPATRNTLSNLAGDIENFDVTGALNFHGGHLLEVGSLASASGTWRLASNGDFVTTGRLIALITSSTGVPVETYAVTSREATIQLSGTTVLEHGRASVSFDDIDETFASIIDPHPTYRVLVTPYGATGSLYVTQRTVDGFDIVESGNTSSGIDVDWMVIAYRRDFAPNFADPSIVIPDISHGGALEGEVPVVDPTIVPPSDQSPSESGALVSDSPDEGLNESISTDIGDVVGDVVITEPMLEEVHDSTVNPVIPDQSAPSAMPAADEPISAGTTGDVAPVTNAPTEVSAPDSATGESSAPVSSPSAEGAT